MVIRVARLEDAPALARVMVDTWPSHRGQMPEEVWTKVWEKRSYGKETRTWVQILRRIDRGATPHQRVFVAEDEGGNVVGYASGGPFYEDRSGKTGEIYSLYVRESHQRRGLGRRLVQALAVRLAELGMTGLRVECLAAGAPARRFYEALGGRVIGACEFDEEGVMLPGVVYGWTDTRALVSTGFAEPCSRGDREPAGTGRPAGARRGGRRCVQGLTPPG